MINTSAYNIIGCTVTGRRHESLGKENEDGYKVYEDHRILAGATADGCSESPCAKAASDAVLEALIEFARGDIWEMKPKQIKNKVLEVIDKHLTAAPYEYGLLACTCALFVTNKASNTYIALSIGDCQAVVMTDELEPKLLLAPVNIFRHRNHTVFANSSLAANAMKIEIGSASSLAGFVLITDGAERFFQASHADDLIQLSSMCILSKDQAQAALENHISNVLAAATNDDITIVMAMRTDSEDIQKVAGATCNTTIEIAVNDDSQLDDYETEDYVPDECMNEEKNSTDSARSSELLDFLREAPRTAEELVVAGYCNPSEVVTSLCPLIKEGIVSYEDYHFASVGG